jgi:hypothetical protein
MPRLRLGLVVTAVALAFGPAPASADITVGSTGQPDGSTPGTDCTTLGGPVVQIASNLNRYAIPASGGALTQWQMNTTGAAGGDAVRLFVLSPELGSYRILAADPERIPSPLPAGNVATFPLSSPIVVKGGELLGVAESSGTAACDWTDGSIPPADTAALLDGAPTVGQTLPVADVESPVALNVAATVQTTEDVSISPIPVPLPSTLASPSVIAFTVRNGGPRSDAITFSDTVPRGLTVGAALAGAGGCGNLGQQVTCSIPSLAPKAATIVAIIVVPFTLGNYTDTATVSVGGISVDPNPANNTATTTLATNPAAPVPPCKIPRLTKSPISIARTLLSLLACKNGRVTRAYSRTIPKGLVIDTYPPAGSYAYHTVVDLQVSAGPRPKARRRHRKHR